MAYGLVAVLCIVGIFTDVSLWVRVVLTVVAAYYAYRSVRFLLP